MCCSDVQFSQPVILSLIFHIVRPVNTGSLNWRRCLSNGHLSGPMNAGVASLETNIVASLNGARTVDSECEEIRAQELC